MQRRADIKYINQNIMIPMDDEMTDKINNLSTCAVDCNPTDEISIYDIANNLKEIIKHEQYTKRK